MILFATGKILPGCGAVSGTYKADGRTENNRTPITPHPRHWHKTSIWNELLYS